MIAILSYLLFMLIPNIFNIKYYLNNNEVSKIVCAVYINNML